MTFIQQEFLWFFALVFTAYWALPHRSVQNLLLLVASCVFYGWVHPWFLILLFGASFLDYLCAIGMDTWPARKRAFLVVSMVGNLGLLGYYKYFNFFVENVSAALVRLGLHPGLHTLEIFLPVGISFYTFQTMSYTIDVYRGELRARKNFVDYAVFVTFFPQLVAGPVERAGNLLAQVEVTRSFSMAAMRSGMALAMWGGFKKVVIADTIAPYVDKIFILKEPTFALVALGSLGFAIQILADFAGYTDIARGISRMMGFTLMENFKHPYLARNPSEFWRRWHVSFSSWIRDYLYIPLGGSRGTFWAMTGATFGAMLISGFWHGAAWTFILWGAYHAALLTAYRLVTPRIPKAVRNHPVGDALAVALMFSFTCFGWLLFRETHLDRLLSYARLSPLAGTPEEWVAAAMMLAVCVACATPLVLGLLFDLYVEPKWGRSRWFLPLQTTGWALQAAAIFAFVRVASNDFIYFQF
jgi:D-alanyl-lipoteichoic acid acyltransferase DltB (MBOAT superfamily)